MALFVIDMSSARFPMGRLVATPGVMDEVSDVDMTIALGRHLLGDWGDVCEEDKQLNDEALKHGDRLLSAYKASDGTKFWIITEGDRSVTTLLRPEEY